MAEEKKKLGEILLEAGVIDKFQLKSALAEQNKWGGRLGNHLVQMGILTEDLLVKALSKQLKIPNLDLQQMMVTPDVLELVPQEIAEKFHLLPVAVKKIANKKTLIVAMSDPTNLDAVDELQFRTGHIIKPAVAGDTAIELAIRRYYYGETGPQRVAGQPIDFDPAAGNAEPAVTNVPSAGVPVPPEAEFSFAEQPAAPPPAQAFVAPTPAVAPMPEPEPQPEIEEASLADLGMEVQPEAEPTQPDPGYAAADGGAAIAADAGYAASPEAGYAVPDAGYAAPAAEYAAPDAQGAWGEAEATAPLEPAPEATLADGAWTEAPAAEGDAAPAYTDPASAWGDAAPAADAAGAAWSEPAPDPTASPEEPTLALEENPPVADAGIAEVEPAPEEPPPVDTWAEPAPAYEETAPAYDTAPVDAAAAPEYDAAAAPADGAAPEYQAAYDQAAEYQAPEYQYDPTAATVDVPPTPDAGYEGAYGAVSPEAEAVPAEDAGLADATPLMDAVPPEALAPPEIPHAAEEASSEEVWPEPGPSVSDEPPPSMDATLEVAATDAASVLDPPSYVAESSLAPEPSGLTPLEPAEPGPAEAAVAAMESVPAHWSAGDAVQTLLGGNEGHFEPTAPGEPTHAGEEMPPAEQPDQLAADGGAPAPEPAYENGAEPTHASDADADAAAAANGAAFIAGETQPGYVLPSDPLGGIPFDTAEGRAIRAICALLMEKGLLTAEELASRLQTAVQGTGEGS